MRRAILILVCVLWVAMVLFGLTARAYGQIMQSHEPPTVPNVEVREFSHGFVRYVDYDNGTQCVSVPSAFWGWCGLLR